MSHACVYGPVPSRRLGRSLGVDLVPFKICTYDCVYCQLGPTTLRTLDAGPWVSEGDVLRDLDLRLSRCGRVDFITLAGSGEPTLNRDLGPILRAVQRHAGLPVAVITNGSLLGRPEVREALMAAEVVMPSLDGATPGMFQRINRPHPGLSFDEMLEGLATFCGEFKGQSWLEVMLVAGLNDGDDHLEALAQRIAQIRPTRTDLNTVVRPAGEPGIAPVSREMLERVQARLPGPVEIIAPSTGLPVGQGQDGGGLQAGILELLARRPCSLQDVSAGLGCAPNEALKVLASMLEQGRIECVEEGGQRFFRGRSGGGALR